MSAASTTAATDGKHPVTPLAGPYGHPFHPILVTIPIGAWVASIVFDIISHTGDDAAVFAKGASWLIGIGLVGALVAAMFGFIDLLGIPTGTRAFRTALTHMGLNLTVVVLFGIGLALRHDDLRDTDGTPAGLLVLSVVALLLLGAAGWLGGKLTYRYGVRVVDDATQADAYQA
jgi:uncharacterized membrane protein